jgi:hypothetical protein
MNSGHWLYFVPLVVSVLWLGIHPNSISASISPSVKHVLAQMSREVEPMTEGDISCGGTIHCRSETDNSKDEPSHGE